MRASRYATSRQKSCLPCSTARAKCDRKAGSCTRCVLRGLSCTYRQDQNSYNFHQGSSIDIGGDLSLSSTDSAFVTPHADWAGANPTGGHTTNPLHAPTDLPIQATGAPNYQGVTTKDHVQDDFELDFSGLHLVCLINADDISNRWLNSYIPVPGQKVKEYAPSISAFIYRVLKSYAGVTVGGRGYPPFVHACQSDPTSGMEPLLRCMALVKKCQSLSSVNETAVASKIQQEMGSLHKQREVYNDVTLLAAFQAYLIYTMVLFFKLSAIPQPFLREAMVNLQELACLSSKQGLVCQVAEQDPPRWEEWIVAESKRRTLFAMYLFDSALSSKDGLPTYLGTELTGLPSSADRLLWNARTRHDWKIAYNGHLAEWKDDDLRIDELWPIPSDTTEADIKERRRRVDLWLETVDEFGTVLYAVTSCTHGG